MPDRLSHLDETGAAHMVDVTAKDATKRVATAKGTVRTGPDVIAMITANGLPKGDALATARIAGIMAVDRAASIDDIRVVHKEGGKTGTWTR